MSSMGLAAEGLIDFQVVRVLKGPDLPAVIRVPGKLTDRDDFNDRRPPYTFVRRGGRRGNCYAYGYGEGAEFLLFLRPGPQGMTPYWAPLAAINEQVRPEEDAWIEWVAGQLKGGNLERDREQ